MKNKTLMILGPTATGKTDLALRLASSFDSLRTNLAQGEIVSCDSRQVYVGLDIGTGKIPSTKFQITKSKSFWEVDGIKVWMYDVVSPKIQYTVADYVKDADKVIEEILDRGKLPIIVGGTGLYLKGLIYGLSNLVVPLDLLLRKKLEKYSKEKLQNKLKKEDLNRWEKMNRSDRENPRRLVRAIELSLASLRGAERRSNLIRSPFGGRNDVLRIGLTAPREVLYKRVDDHVVNRLNQGMIDEAKNLHKKGLSLARMRQLGLEYGVLAEYLSGKIREIKGDRGLIKIIQNKIHGFVRRQLTWFKKEKDVTWFDITDKNFPENVEKLVSKWYYASDAAKKS